MSIPAGTRVAPPVKESRPEHPTWLRALPHYDPDYPYDTNTYEYGAWVTTDPYYVKEDVHLSPTTHRHQVFLEQAKANFGRFLALVGRSESVSQEVLIKHLPEVPEAPHPRDSVAPDLALWPAHVELGAPEGLSWARHGPPRLVVEALSESNKEKDLEDNPRLYDAMGVEEYWVCDPEAMTWVAVYQREGDGPLAEVDWKGKASLYSPVLQTEVRVDAEAGLQSRDPDTGEWIELIASVRQEGRAEGLAEGRAEGRVEGLAEGRAGGRVEERWNALMDLVSVLADEEQVACLKEELANTPFAQWPTVRDLHGRYTLNPDDTP